MKPGNIELQRERLEEFCKKHHIRRMSLFGSVLHDDFRPNSDIDVLVEFEPGHVPGLSFWGIQAELSELLSRPVDLNTSGFLSKYLRDQVLEHGLGRV